MTPRHSDPCWSRRVCSVAALKLQPGLSVIAAALFWMAAQPVPAQAVDAASGSAPAKAAEQESGSSGAPATDEDGPQVTANVHPGGSLRYASNRWGAVKATVANESDGEQTILVVTTPPGAEGLQYARRITVPARSVFDAQFAVKMGVVEKGTHELGYLVFPGGTDEGQLTHVDEQEGPLPSLTVPMDGGSIGLAGWISDPDETPWSGRYTSGLLRALRFEQHRSQLLVSVQPVELTGLAECLEPLDSLGVSSSKLIDFPLACESIRNWVQRGGRLFVFLEQTGPELVPELLGDTLSLTVVGRTSANQVRLDLNPAFRTDRYPVREVTATFDEPVEMLRVMFDGGEMMWSVDGWPVAVHVPVGAGHVTVTTISPEVFVRPAANPDFDRPAYSLVESMRPMVSAFASPRAVPLINEAAMTTQATTAVGYRIPSQSRAALLALVFPVALLGVGLWLLRRGAGQKLVWVLPLLAVLGALPAVGLGLQTRAVAPETVIETQIVHAVPGARVQAGSGYAAWYSPRPSELNLQMDQGVVLENRADSMNRDYRRQVWDGPESSRWQNLNQPAGLRTFTTYSRTEHPTGLRAVVSFDESGLTGIFQGGGFQQPADLLLASSSPDRLSLRLAADGTLSAGPDDVLAPGRYTAGTLMSDAQRRRSLLLDAVFSNKDRVERFPEVPSLLFWATEAQSPLVPEDSGVRGERETLVVLPVQFSAPPAGQRITIPAPLLPYQMAVTAEGGRSSMFDNARRQWSRQESPGAALLQFDLPVVCLPFEPQSAEVELLIRAGSRQVTLSAGDPAALQSVASLSSPLGTQTFEIPADVIRSSSRVGKIYLQLQVGELDKSLNSENSSGEQDDSWAVERLLLTLRGQRVAGEANAATESPTVENSP